ncbi:MAG: biotin/lipoyl-binding protein [Anaerolineae bacterium]|jgi:biotin carboxyl carrier protein|nr:biotin/lipoyl-binding protein [Anaerolineae bacterium]
MAKYKVVVEQEEFLIEFSENRVQVNGEVIEQPSLASLNGNGLYLLQQGGEKQEVHIQHQQRSAYQITIGGHHLTAEIERDRGNRRATGSLRTAGEITAPMPAVMVDLLVIEGDAIQAGQTVLVLEAMKMQMKISSPVDGIVNRILKTPGQRVEKGEVLLKIDMG